jgi:membrane protease YdiL (CAAX protease family)
LTFTSRPIRREVHFITDSMKQISARLALLVFIAVLEYLLGKITVHALQDPGALNQLFCWNVALSEADKDVPNSVLSILNVVFLSPVIEEYFFRRLLIVHWQRRMNIHAAVFLSSLIFAAAHVQCWHPSLDVPRLLGVFESGIVCGYCFAARSSIVDSSIVHSLGNAIILMPKGPMPRGCLYGDYYIPTFVYPSLIVLLCASIFYLIVRLNLLSGANYRHAVT